MPLDVAAQAFQGRIYLASRWDTFQEGDIVFNDVIAINFSEDSRNWSGWRVPQSDVTHEAGSAAALAATGNHLYIFASELVASSPAGHLVWVH
jgi:hypothetical protein